MVIINAIHTPAAVWRVEGHQQGTSYWYRVTRNGVLHADRLTVTDALATVRRLADADATADRTVALPA